MFKLISLLLAAALMSQQCILEVAARQIGNKKFDLNYALRAKGRAGRRFWKVVNFVKIIPPPETVHHQAGTTSLLECRANGHPVPTVVWMKNGEPLPDFEQQAEDIINFDRTSITELVSRLVVTAPSNGDVYTCVATARGNEDKASITVLTDDGEDGSNVLEQLLDFPMEPVITTFYNHVLQEYGSTVTLPCRFKSLTDTQVFWFDSQKRPVYGNPQFKVLPSGDLNISKLEWSDMGDFTCTVKNQYGKDSVETFVYPVRSEDFVH